MKIIIRKKVCKLAEKKENKKEPEVIKADEMVKKEELVKKEQEYEDITFDNF